jgi:ABC-type phosphate/phosphonate transport system permease subunit
LVLEYVLAIIYLLALPVMFNFAFNGFVARWTLPDFPSMFVGFLSLFQIALVAVLGLLLAGIVALIVGFLTPKGRVLPV